jgi:hypothetical protein
LTPTTDFYDFAPGDSGTWSFGGNTLLDTKGYNRDTTSFDSLYPGATLTLHWQQNRLKYIDACGQTQYVCGPTRLWRRVKISVAADPTGRYWQLILDDPATYGLTPPF